MKHLIFNWTNVDSYYVTAEKMNQLIDKCEHDKELREVEWYFARRVPSIYKTWARSVNSSGVCLRIFHSLMNYSQYIFNGAPENTKEEHTSIVKHLTGKKAYDILDDRFQKEYGDDVSLFTAFSGMKYKEVYTAIKENIPKPVCSMEPKAYGKIFEGCYKIDISSAYPNEASKTLPTFHDYKKVKGKAMPTKEYPFAFYLKSHHMSVLNEFSTWEWKNYKRFYTLYDQMFKDVEDSEEETILCKVSEYPLGDIFQDLYVKKQKGDPDAKLAMNAAIGWFQKKTCPRLSHLSAVIIGRCCDRILKMAKHIETEGNRVLIIMTDAILWKGKLIANIPSQKYLGAFTYEYRNISFYGLGPKAYQVKDEFGNVTTKYSGMKNGTEKEQLQFGQLPEPKEKVSYEISSSGRISEIGGLANG